MQTLMVSTESKPSRFVTASSSMPLTMQAWRVATESNQPQRRGRPVVAPNSRPMRVEHVGDLGVLRRQRALADARGVGLHHAHHAVHAVRRNARAGAGAARGGVGGGDERIGAVINVEERALRALEQDVRRRAASPRAAAPPCWRQRASGSRRPRGIRRGPCLKESGLAPKALQNLVVLLDLATRAAP